MRRFIPALLALLVEAFAAFAQTEAPKACERLSSNSTEAAPEVSEIAFVGLRRIAPATLRAHISLREGEPLDETHVKGDVRALGRLGWFDGIRAETRRREDGTMRLVFFLEERPFLAKVDFSGSKLLSRQQIDRLLTERQIALRLAALADPVELHRAARAVESALAELGHPQAHVELSLDTVPTEAIGAHFHITDGPRVFVAPVEFTGSAAMSERRLQHEMQRIAPQALFASLRGKNVYTPERLNEDRERLLAYYQNHGYPEARMGTPQITLQEGRVRRWFPRPCHKTITRYHIAIPIDAGTFYRFAPVEVSGALAEGANARNKRAPSLAEAQPGRPYSARAIEHLRRAWRGRIETRGRRDSTAPAREVEVTQAPDSSSRTVRVKLDLRESERYIVRRVEFLGTRRFSDRYYRRRAQLEEGRPLDEQALERSLARLARTGYIRAIKKDDIRIRLDDAGHTADVSIRVEEMGQQRVSLVGGHANFGSTIGVAYTVFDLLGGEELLTAHLEGGPQTLQTLLGIAKEGFPGTRGSLALAVFHNLVRPRLGRGESSPLFTSRSTGFNAGWSYAASQSNSLGVNYERSHTLTRYTVALPPELAGLPNSEVRTETSSRSLGVGWARDTGRERFLANASASGGVLGGNENLLRASIEYGRIFPDPFLRRGNAWAFRGTAGGAGSYQGDMPLYARLFAGDESVRGFRPGELGPLAAMRSASATGAEAFRAMPAGANLAAAWNTEYRVPLTQRSEAVGFFDIGSGRLMPSWLGIVRPALLAPTNGVLRGSTGLELRYRVPGVEVPVRVNYALNVLRLRRALRFPDGSAFRPADRRAAFGWALGSLF